MKKLLKKRYNRGHMKYIMPAEWDLHEGTWLAWPHNKEHWPGKFDPIPPVFAKMAIALRDAGEKVFICVKDEKMERSAKKIIGKDLKDIFFYQIRTDSSWIRDFGPIFVKDEAGKRIITNWVFNMWGGKYPPWDFDDIVPRKVARELGIHIMNADMILEGGSIDVNGKGTLLTTEQCLLNENRNPTFSRERIEQYLNAYLGATNVLWLKEGIIGDDTDGHIDDIARFVDPRTVVCVTEEDTKDENYAILQKNLEDLKKMKDQDGKPLRTVELPMPEPVFYKGQRLPASYANFYIANKAVLVPIFNCKRDEKALKVLTDIFPTRKIVGIDCVDLVWGLGTIHCSTQQQPV